MGVFSTNLQSNEHIAERVRLNNGNQMLISKIETRSEVKTTFISEYCHVEHVRYHNVAEKELGEEPGPDGEVGEHVL